MTGKIIPGITILLLIIVTMTSPALAASAGVSPANIILNGTQGETYTVNFSAVNTGNDTTDYSIYARGNITNWTTISLQSVTLEGKKAFPTQAFITIPTDLPDGTYKGDIIIKSIPDSAGSGNKISVAVNLPVTLAITRPGIEPWILISVSIVVLLLGWTAFRLITRAAKKKEEQKHKAEVIINNHRAMTKFISAALILFMLVQFISVGAGINTSVTVIEASTPAPTQNPPSGSSSGGSGGMGVISTECFSNIQLKETRENDLRFGQYVSFTFTSDIPVYEVDVKGLSNENEVTIRVEQLVNLSCKLTEKPQGDIYRYLNIFSGVQQDGVKIKFKISNGWLSGGTVVLVRWQDGSWKDLPTTVINKDNKYTYYEATSTGFSSFAIVGLGMAEVTATPVGETPAKPEKVANATAVPTEKTPGFEIALFVAVFSAVYLFRRKRG